MLKFKQVSILFLLALAACNLSKPVSKKDGDPQTATFFVEKTSIKQSQSEIHPEITLPLARFYNFEACLKDNQLSRPLENHRFKIELFELTQELLTDSNGCLHWNQKVAFNYLAPAKWVSINAHLTALGFHSGQKTIAFAINPWEEKAESLLSQKIDNAIPAENAHQALQFENEEGLWLDDLRVIISERSLSSEVQIELKGLVSILTTKLDGKKIPEPIAKGDFDLDISLINISNQSQILAEAKSIPAEIVGGHLNFKKPLTIGLKACSLGPIELALKLVPKAANIRLKNFEAIYSNLGECDQLKGGFSAKLKTSINSSNAKISSLQEYLKNPSLTDDHSAFKQSPEVAASGIQVKELNPSNVGYSGSMGLKKVKSFSITACLTHPFDRKPVPAQDIKIQKINGSSEIGKTLSSGCLTWDDSIEFNLLDKECWQRKSFQLANPELNFKQQLSLDINPWDEGPGSIRDSRKGNSILQCPNGVSKLNMQGYDFDLKGEGISHPIDNFLNIKLRKNGTLRIPLRLMRPTTKNAQGMEDLPAPPGKYFLRWAILDSRVSEDFLKNPLLATNFIYQAEEIAVQIESAGTITEQLSLESFDTKSIGNLNHILFEIEPAEYHPNFELQTFIGSILLSDRKSVGSLTAVSSGKSLIKDLIQQAKKDREQSTQYFKRIATKESYAFGKKLHLLNLPNTERALGFPSEVIKSWIRDGNISPDESSKLCQYWVYSLAGKDSSRLSLALARSYLECKTDLLKHRNNYLDVSFVYFLEELKLIRELEPTFDMKQLASGYVVNFALDKTFTKSLDVNGGFNTGRWFSPFSVGGGGRLQWASSERKSQINGATNQTAKQLQIENLSFQLEAIKYEKCMAIQISPHILPKWLDLIPEEAKERFMSGYLLCSGESSQKRKNFVESYTIINQILFAAHFSNPSSQNARSYFMAIRGQSEFERFLDLLSQATATPDNATTEFFAKKSLDSQYHKLFEDRGMTFPGVFVGRD